jgi:dihydrofolate synthase/folylpolyglutamate synthase
MSKPDLAAWLGRLESLHPVEIELGLERIAEVARRLECDRPDCPVVTVAGTNGKGSTVAVLEALALDAGMRVGSYTSPHLLRFNERVRIDGQGVDDAALIAAFEAIEAARRDISLTYFEFATLAGLWLFSRADLQLMVLEVGLGGRLDGVNIVDADVAVITSISLDHQDWLGSSIEEIAREKAGILRANQSVVLAQPTPPQVLLDSCKQLSCETWRYDKDYAQAFPNAPLRRENIAAAWRVAEILGFAPPRAQASALLESVQLAGRLQCLSLHGRQFVLDVAHNEAAVENLASFLKIQRQGRCRALFTALSDKDIHAMIRSCNGRFERWYICGLPGVDRARSVEDIAAVLREEGEQVGGMCENPRVALRLALKEQEEGDTLAVFGSFHTVAEVLQELEQMRSSA